jgi:hypothetical protein
MQAYQSNVNTTKYGLKSFCYEAPQIWNSLPNEMRQADNYRLFVRDSDYFRPGRILYATVVCR